MTPVSSCASPRRAQLIAAVNSFRDRDRDRERDMDKEREGDKDSNTRAAEGISAGVTWDANAKEVLASGALWTAANTCTNAVSGHELALEVQHNGDVRAIFPVLVGVVQDKPAILIA